MGIRFKGEEYVTYRVQAVDVSSHEDAEIIIFEACEDLDLAGPNVFVQHAFADGTGRILGTADELLVGRDDGRYSAVGGVAGMVVDAGIATILLNAAGRRGLAMMSDIVIHFDPANSKMARAIAHLDHMLTLVGLPVRRAG